MSDGLSVRLYVPQERCYIGPRSYNPTDPLKKILERQDHYLNVARRTFTNLFLRVPYSHRAASNLNNKILPKKADISLLKISICILAYHSERNAAGKADNAF
jgi:hypothetical protein